MNQSQPRRVIVVLGMHRSGTSMLARGIKALGAELGDKMMPELPQNPRGFWEDTSIVALNEKILANLGLTWNSVTLIDPSQWDEPALQPLKLEAVELIRSRFGAFPIWGFKDPRSARLLPFWQSVLAHMGIEDSYVIVVRNPLSVARSLAARDHLAPEKSHLLWLQHVLPAVSETSGRPRVVVDYDQVMAAPAAQLERIADALGIQVSAPVRQALEEYATTFVSPQLRHTVFHQADVSLDPAAPSLTSRAYTLLHDVAEGRGTLEDTGFRKEWASITESLHAMRPIIRHLDDLGSRLARQNDQLAQAEATISEKDNLLQAHRQELAHVSDELVDAKVALMEKDHLLLGTAAELANAQATAAEQSASILALEARIAQFEGHCAQLVEQIAMRVAEIDAIHGSTSWRVTQPLRLVGGFVKSWWSGHGKPFLRHSVRAAYYLLPLSDYRRFRLKSFFYQRLGFLLANTCSYQFWRRSLDAGNGEPNPHAQELPSLFPDDFRVGKIDGEDSFEFRATDAPVVSVVILADCPPASLFHCLKSIHANPCSNAFEVIVVDDGSGTGALQALSRIGGIRRIRNEGKPGLARARSLGASQARGKYLLFLAAETQVLPHWLDELVSTFVAFPNAGLVGSKLIQPNRHLKEAGGIVLPDGSLLGIGCDDDPHKPEYNYLREVDYCSGTSAMLPAVIFRQACALSGESQSAGLGDAELALAIRAQNRDVLYQPLSQVVHFDAAATREESRANPRRQAGKKWHGVLGERERASPKILIIDGLTPTPDQDSGSVDAFYQMKILLSLSYRVTFIPSQNFQYLNKYTPDLQRMGVECLYAPYVTSVEAHLKQSGDKYAFVVLSRIGTATTYMHQVRKYCPRARVIFNTVDLHHLREQRQAELEGSEALARQAQITKKLELRAIEEADCTIVISKEEERLLLDEVPAAHIFNVPLIMDIADRIAVPFEERQDIFFIGGYKHLPNVDAVLYFTKSIWPRVREKLPGIKFYVIGSSPPQEILDLSNDNVIVVGYCPDVSSYFNQCRISIAPLRFGAGIKGKIGRSLGYGVPCVATDVAIEGTELSSGENVLVATDAAKFADSLVALYSDANLWNRLSENGRLFFEETYSLAAGTKKLSCLLHSLADGPAPSTKKNAPPNIAPLRAVPASSYEEYVAYVESMGGERVRRQRLEQRLAEGGETFSIPGFCYVCHETTEFHVDFAYSFSTPDGKRIPNWRERLVCPGCGLNNRARAAIHLFEHLCKPDARARLYVTEQTTPLFAWLGRSYPDIVGSEYLGDSVPCGESNASGIRNESLLQLSFSDDQFDHILSFDVFEHIPDYRKAFQECLRCLKTGGSLFFSVPFSHGSQGNIVRARLGADGQIEHILPPEYHGDPLNSSGCLCYYHFGWQLLAELREMGFSTASAHIYWSQDFGYLGGDQILFVAKK